MFLPGASVPASPSLQRDGLTASRKRRNKRELALCVLLRKHIHLWELKKTSRNYFICAVRGGWKDTLTLKVS